MLCAILFIVYMVAGQDILEKSVGVSRAELTDAGRYWIVIVRGAIISGLIFCFFAFCAWLGHRVKKQRAATGGAA